MSATEKKRSCKTDLYREGDLLWPNALEDGEVVEAVQVVVGLGEGGQVWCRRAVHLLPRLYIAGQVLVDTWQTVEMHNRLMEVIALS